MTKIFIGVLFLFFHFRINGIDLLPQFVGYLFIGFGFDELQKTDPAFAKRSKLFYLFSAIQVLGDIVVTIYTDRTVLVSLLIVATCMIIYTLYCIYQAVRDSERQVGELGAPHLKICWLLYTTIAVFGSIVGFIPFPHTITNVLAIILAVGGAIILISYTVVLFQTMNCYKNREKLLTAQAERNDSAVVSENE